MFLGFFFFENNYKCQIILLVSNVSKLFRKLATQFYCSKSSLRDSSLGWKFPVNRLLPSFFFSFFFLHLSSHSLLLGPQKPKQVLPSSSKSISQNPKPKSRSQSEQKSKPKNHDFGTGAPLVCLLIRFMFFLGSSVSDGIFSVVGLCFLRLLLFSGFFSFLVGLLVFSGLLFCTVLGFYVSELLHFLRFWVATFCDFFLRFWVAAFSSFCILWFPLVCYISWRELDFFFLNNYKIQTILLVSQSLKLFWYITNRVQRTRFWCINWVYCTRFPTLSM